MNTLSWIAHIAPLISLVASLICWPLGLCNYIWPTASFALALCVWGPTLFICMLLTAVGESTAAAIEGAKK